VSDYWDRYGDGGGMDWTDVRRSIAEAIPPAYTRYIGEYLYAALVLKGWHP